METIKVKYKVCVRCMTFNQALYITDAMNGFCMQQTSFPFVCCIVDDASTDGERDVINKYVEEHFDFSENSVGYKNETDYAYITFAQHKTNKNCYFAVLLLKENLYSKKQGYKKLQYISEWDSSTDYIALCEGDDYWIDPLKLQKQVDFLEEHQDYSMCWTDAYQDTNGQKKAYTRYPKDGESPIGDIIEQGGLWIPTASTLYRSCVLKKYYTLKDVPICDYTLQMFAAFTGKIYYISTQSCIYRYMSQGSWTSSVDNASKEKLRDLYLGEKKILETFNALSDYRYNMFFELRTARVLFMYACFLKENSSARRYLKLRDKYSIPTDRVIRMEVNGFGILAKLYREYAKSKIKIINSFIKE